MQKLKKYNEKRDFSKTSEPSPSSIHVKENDKPVFVVQRHDASRLHFDLRLEVDGVLKSWAVPKGPSLNPKDSRLAVMTEDHPLAYATFEGEIPKGEYGGGTVEIWDSGTWEPAEEYRDVEAALDNGLLEFVLHGSKLKGEFAIFKTKYKGAKDSWLLKKKKDEYAVTDAYDATKIPSK